MKLNRQLFAYLLVICLLVCVLPVPYAVARQGDGELEAEYGEAKYSDIALDAYSRMPSFHNGAIIVTNEDGRTGLVNAKEEEILPFQYNGLNYLSENRYIFYTDESDGIINTDGEVLLRFSGWDIRNGILCVYDDYSDFSTYSYYTMDLKPSNRAAYMGVKTIPPALENIKEWDYHPNKKHPEFDYYTIYVGKQRGVLNANFKAIIPLQDYDIRNLSYDDTEPIFEVGTSSTKYGLITYRGDVLFPVGSFQQTWKIGDTAIYVQQSDSERGLIDYDGNWLISIGKYQEITRNGNNTFLVRSNKERGVIDCHGNWLLPMGEYQEIGETSPDGYVYAVTYDGSLSEHTITNIVSKIYKNGILERTITGKWISSKFLTTSSGGFVLQISNAQGYLSFTSNGTFYGLMNINGTVLVNETYGGFRQIGNYFAAYTKDTAQYILLDENGHSILDRSYTSISKFIGWDNLPDDLYLVRDGEFYGIRHLNGGYLFPTQYKSISYLSKGLYLVSDGELYGVRRLDGEYLLPMRYKGIIHLSDELYVVGDGNSYGLKQVGGEYTALPIHPIYEATGSESLLELYDGEYYHLVDTVSNKILVSQVPEHLILPSGWYRHHTHWIGSLNEAKEDARELSGYTDSVFAFTSGDWYDGDITTYYIDCDAPAFMGKLSCNASNINEDGLFAYWNADSDTYGFGHLKGKRPWDSQQNPGISDGKITNLYPESGKILNLDAPSKGTSATNYLDAKPRIFFDRAVDSYAGRAKLDFSNGTLEIRRSSDNGLVYSVKESAGNPGTSNQMPLWGEASPYTAVRLEDAVSVLDYETEYYVVMPEGFVKFSDGTASPAIKKGDWTFKTEKAPTYRMVPMTEFGEPTIHYSGTASVWFRVEDENQNPVTDATIYYQLGDGKQESVHPDGNGLIPVVTPHIDKAQRFFVTFSAKRNNSRGVRSINILNSEQYFDVRVRELSYKQEWSGSLSGSASAGLNAGAGAKTGVVEAQASLIDASVSAGYKGTMSVSDAYDNGQRTLTMKASTKNDRGIKLKAGTEAQAIKGAKITVLGVSGGAKAANQLESALKIKDYDPNNPDHALQIGTFVLASSLFNSRSVLANHIYSLLGVKIGNQSGNTNSLSVSGSADIVKVKFGLDDVNDISGNLGGINASAVWSWKTSQDFVKDLTTRSKSLQAEMGGGLISLKITPNKGTKENVNTPLFQSNFNSYALGASLSASKEISATMASSGELDSVAYQTYIGGEKDIFWDTDSVDYYSDVVFQGERARAIQDNNREIREFINGTNPFINIQQAIDDMRSSGQIGTVEETTKTKRGFDQNFPIGLSLGVELDLGAGLAGSHSYSYVDCNGVLYNETLYVTSVSDVTANLVKSQSVSFMDLLTGPIETVWNTIKDEVASTFDKASNGVKNACAMVSDTVSNWFVSVSSVPDATLQSYEIATLMSGSEPDTNVSVSATLGDAYSVAVFADNARENPVSDDQLADHPLTLTLEYTDAMLTAAGASPDSTVQIFYFDSDRNLYVYESSSVHDKSQKTVTAQITKNGEYVLATDSSSPLITDFHVDNQTLTPSFTVLVSDLSGLADFRFWIDNDTPLVTMRNLQDYYNSDTGVFEYSFSYALSEGRHTAYFSAKDVLGNANAEPISFPFEAHASQGTIVLAQFPTSAITVNQPFTVKATGTHMDTFNTVALRCTAGNQTLFTLPMVWQEDAWIAQVTPVQGVENLTITAVAEDAWGNTVTSESVTITMNLTENLSSVQIQTFGYPTPQLRPYL